MFRLQNYLIFTFFLTFNHLLKINKNSEQEIFRQIITRFQKNSHFDLFIFPHLPFICITIRDTDGKK